MQSRVNGFMHNDQSEIDERRAKPPYLLEEAYLKTLPTSKRVPTAMYVTDHENKKPPLGGEYTARMAEPSHDHVRNSSPSRGVFNLSAVFFLF